MDIVTNTIDNSLTVYRNESKNEGTHWLMVRAMTQGRDAIGARIVIELPGKTLVRAAIPGQSYLSSNDPRVHIGLGRHSQINQIAVQWPDGTHGDRRQPGNPDRAGAGSS